MTGHVCWIECLLLHFLVTVFVIIVFVIPPRDTAKSIAIYITDQEHGGIRGSFSITCT